VHHSFDLSRAGSFAARSILEVRKWRCTAILFFLEIRGLQQLPSDPEHAQRELVKPKARG